MTVRKSTRLRARVAAVVTIGASALVMTALPAFAQADGDAYVGPTPPEVAPSQAEVAPAAEAEVAASAPVSGGLPMTGGDVVGLLAIGASAIVAGGALVAVRHRRA